MFSRLSVHSDDRCEENYSSVSIRDSSYVAADSAVMTSWWDGNMSVIIGPAVRRPYIVLVSCLVFTRVIINDLADRLTSKSTLCPEK